MAWGKEWLVTPVFTPKPEWLDDVTDIKPSLSAADTITEAHLKKGLNIIPRKHNNLPPTHDPYANPNAHIYYQCACGAILDPGTKSFAGLNNAAMNAGWKVRWGEKSYQPYCVKCGEDVE